MLLNRTVKMAGRKKHSAEHFSEKTNKTNEREFCAAPLLCYLLNSLQFVSGLENLQEARLARLTVNYMEYVHNHIHWKQNFNYNAFLWCLRRAVGYFFLALWILWNLLFSPAVSVLLTMFRIISRKLDITKFGIYSTYV